MEYEKSPTTTAFSRKMTNRSHSHSLSFTTNAIYDGVFSSPKSTKSPTVDYGEIFRGSGPSPSSIPFLDVPELNNGKIKVDVRSSKLDYSSVFGGFGACDFDFTPMEVIVKPEKKKKKEKRNRRKSGDDGKEEEKKNLISSSSPEVVRMKHSDVSMKSNHQNEIQVPTMVDSTQVVDKILEKVEVEPLVASVEKKVCDVSIKEEVMASRKRSSKTDVDFEKVSTRENLTCKTDLDGGKMDVKPPSSLQRTSIDFENVFGQNGVSTRENLTSKTDSDGGKIDVKPLSCLQGTSIGENGASTGLKSGTSENFQEDDVESPGSPMYFDAESDEGSMAAAESSAALKKALEEAQVRMNIAKQMMDRKKSGFCSFAKPKFRDDAKVESKKDEKVEGITEEIGDDSSQIPSEVAKSSEIRDNSSLTRDDSSQILSEEIRDSSPNEGDQHAKRARKTWEVPEGLQMSTSDHKVGEVEEQEVAKMEEEHARRGRKHWDLPGTILKSVMNGKQQEPENREPAKPETDTKQEVQPVTENPFYTFGQLGSKIKCVVEAFTGSKVSQTDEIQVTEKENSILPQIFQGEESESQEMLAGIPVMETYLREVEETPQQTESKSETKIEEESESKMCKFTEECSQEMEKETLWQVKSACESEDGPKCGVNDLQENPDPTNDFLDRDGEKEIVSEPQEMFISPDDSTTYVREVEEIPTNNQSQFDEGVGTMVSFVTENSPEPGNIHKETEHKAPRRRRVWKTSEDVYNMIRAPKGNNRPWELESAVTETAERSFQMEGVTIHEASVETESTSQQATDSGLQENWTVLKQMFRQMFQTTDTTKGEDESYCLVESEKEHNDTNGKETAGTSYCQMIGTDASEHNDTETVKTGHGAYANISENEDLEAGQEAYCREEDGNVEVKEKTSSVRELIGEELEATGMASFQGGEDIPEVFEEAGSAQELSEHEIKEHADSRAEMLEYDRCETDSTSSEQKRELADETKIDGSVDTDTSRSSFEMRQDDSYVGEVGAEQDLGDQYHEKNSAASTADDHVEEIDSDSIQSGWSVVEDEEKIKFYVEEILAGHIQEGGESKPEEVEETKEESDEMRTSLGEENNDDKTERVFECRKEEIDRSSVEPAESSCCLPKGDEKIDAATDRTTKYDEGEESCRSSMEEEGDVASSNSSQNEAEQVEKPLKKKDEAKEKEREREKERLMVERAIREARERAFADARERAGKAAMEKAKAGVPRKGTSEIPRRSEKGSADVNDKLSSAEKASLQAKLRSERAAVERALSEARVRALEKALSCKSAASQTRSYGGSKSFSSSGERRGSSSSGTENKSSGTTGSSNQTAKAEPIQRCKARSERQQRTSERAAEALAEKKLRDLKTQKEQAERNRLAETLDADVKRWSNGKESNLRALLSTLQYILGAESGWKPIPLTDLVSTASVRKAYRKATLYVHPDKLQQRGASTQQKYICEKVFDLLKEAWNKFGADER